MIWAVIAVTRWMPTVSDGLLRKSASGNNGIVAYVGPISKTATLRDKGVQVDGERGKGYIAGVAIWRCPSDRRLGDRRLGIL